MIRKVICVATGLLVLAGSLAVGASEAFTLRNGIKFGERIGEVLAKETLELTVTSKEKLEATNEKPVTSLETVSGTVAGISDISLQYKFSDEGKLVGVVWNFPSYSSSDSADSEYESLYKAFVRKYGDPLGNTGGKIHIIHGSAIESAVLMAYLYEQAFDYGVGDIRDYHEWIIFGDGGNNTKIDLVEYYYGTSYSDREFYLKISYDYFSDQDLDDAIKEKEQGQQLIEDDI